jgi:hypothetical protein
MSVKQFLNQGFHLNQLIQTNQEELRRLRELAVSIQSPDLSSERVQTSGRSDRVGDIVAKVVDLEADIQRDLVRYITAQHEIRRLIYAVKDDRLKLILQKCYINFQKWERISEDLDIDLRYVYRLHNQALQEATKKSTVKHI